MNCTIGIDIGSISTKGVIIDENRAIIARSYLWTEGNPTEASKNVVRELERQVEGAVEIIYKTLKETGLQWDEGPDIGGPVGPYIQSQRMGMFKKYAEQLVESGHAYYCFCDKERLDEVRKVQEASGMAPRYDGHCRNLSKEEVAEKLAAGIPYVIRQKVPTEGTVTFHDEVYGDVTVECSTLDDQILIKGDGMPTYNFANVVDDHTMGITHVLRGNEYLSSTPKYNLLYEAFGWEIPKYIHCAPVMRDATHKLSKRHGDASYEDLVQMGFLTRTPRGRCATRLAYEHLGMKAPETGSAEENGQQSLF